MVCFFRFGANCPEAKHIQRSAEDMDVQELNKRERLARLDAYFSELKEILQAQPKKGPEEEGDEKG